jgi:hypothetical protein
VDIRAPGLVGTHFRLKVAESDEGLFRHYLQGIKLKALFYGCCNKYAGNTEIRLEKYKDHERPTGGGPFLSITWHGFMKDWI